MMIIFIDSGPFRAVYTPGDQHIDRARNRFAKIREKNYKMVLSEYVVDEIYTGILTSATYDSVMEFDAVLRMGDVQMEKITPERFAAAQEIFRRYNKDKKWSFTDCTSYVIMKELKIKQVFTFDKNFEEMGFEVL